MDGRRRSLVAGLVALGLLGAACGSPPNDAANPGPMGSPQGTPGSEPGMGAPPPAGDAVVLPTSATELPDVDPAGFRRLLAELEGTPVLVNIWASWCGPCYQEAPALSAMAKQFEGRVQFVGVDILDRRSPAREFIAEFGWTFPSVFDPDGAIRDDLGLIGQPHTIIYDASGERVFLWSGAVNEALLEEELEKVTA